MGQIKNIKLHIVTDIKTTTLNCRLIISVKMGENEEQTYTREESLDNEEMKKIFVRGIPFDAQDDEFKSFFEGMCGGTVSECSIVRKDGQSEKKNLFGFVTFETSELVDEVLLKRDSLTFNGKQLEANRAVPKTNTWIGAHEKTKKLFIANLPKDTKEDDLMAYLVARHPTKYGTIESIQLIKEKNPHGSKTDINKGYGFVFVSSEDMADKMAIQHANFTFGGRKIELKKSVPSGSGEGGRGRGRGRGGERGGRGGRGGGQFQGYGGYAGGDGGYGGQWATDQYAGGYGGYDGGFAGGYGGGFGGYGAPAMAGAGGGRGRGRGGAQGTRFQPY